MNGYNKPMHVGLRRFAPLLLAAALAAPGASSAVTIDDQVTTRAEPLQQHYGRDSVYGLSPEPIYRPAQTQPERYGRAGGYTGSDRVELMNSALMSDTGARIVEPQSAHASQPADSGAADSGRPDGRRFDNPDSAHGQDEGGVQTR